MLIVRQAPSQAGANEREELVLSDEMAFILPLTSERGSATTTKLVRLRQ